MLDVDAMYIQKPPFLCFVSYIQKILDSIEAVY